MASSPIKKSEKNIKIRTSLVRILAGSLRILKDPQGSCRNPARTGSFQDPFRNLQGSYKDPARQGSL